MKKVLTNNKGISFIMLVITVLMMAIIVSFAVFSSRNITPESKLAAAYASLKAVKEACDNAQNLIEINPNEYDEYYFFGQNVHELVGESELQTLLGKFGFEDFSNPNEVISKRTYLIKNTTSDNDKRILERLELSNVSSTYLVDLENEKYYILNGVERVDDLMIYEYKDIVKEYNILIQNQ